MTGMAWADEPKLTFIDHAEPTIMYTHGDDKGYKYTFTIEEHPMVEIFRNGDKFSVDKTTIEASCPDGYELTTKLTNRNYDKECQNGRPDVICYHNMKFTDAELRCVKDSQ